MQEWDYFIGGRFDLTKRAHHHKIDDRYLRLAFAPALVHSWTSDPDILAQPVAIESQTYRLMTKIPQDNGDVAWIYVHMPPPRNDA